MSNGSEVGGIIGGVIGAYFGGTQGFQWGYAIGSSIGGYVDPQRSYGPRLTDATTQTSTVGGVIPFGYGIFTTAGNIIWTDELKEHRHEERAGKGGGEKQITYTYTRSYAIGVCKGKLHRYLWIKRNGKLVYAAEPAKLGQSMGWNAKLIADLTTSSRKFMEKCTLYYGTDDQMPSATIVAVKGVGNVSPFRDLAYIVLKDDDLTDLRGGIAQFEFCVQASGLGYVTSPPYVLESVDNYSVNLELAAVRVDETVIQLGGFSAQIEIDLEVVETRLPEFTTIEGFGIASELPSIELISVRTQQEIYLGRSESFANNLSIEVKNSRVSITRHSPNRFASQAGSITIGVDIP